MTTLQTALAWHDRGVTPIPCKPATKKPSIAWGRWQQRRPPQRLVERWFTPPRNLALLTGNPLLVLDFDKLSSYYKWKVDCPDLAETYTVTTPRPGRHVYFHVNKPVSTLHIGDIDVRGTRALVMALPSVHPSGEMYKAVNPGAPMLGVAGLDQVLPDWQRLANSVKENLQQVYQGAPAQANGHSLFTEFSSHRSDLIGRIKRAFPILVMLQRWTLPIPSSRDGRWFVMRCPHPNHPDHNPSFWADVRRGLCGCFKSTCAETQPAGKAMDVINLWAWLHGIDNRRAILDMAREV